MRTNKMNLDSNEYLMLRSIQFENQKQFAEQQIGGRKKLYVNNHLIGSTVNGYVDLQDLTSRQFAAFLGMFNRGLYSQIRKNDLLNLKVNFKGVSRSKNHKGYERLPVGSIFYNIDLNSAYWQIAHKLGYISDNVFNKYQFDDKYKSVKRLCVSFLSRPNKKTYHQLDGTAFTVHCDTSILKQVYDNIRSELYRTINDIADQVDYIEYNIDGISILPEDKQLVKQYFNDLGLLYSTKLCVKLDEYKYKSGIKVKNWKRKINLK